MAFIAQLPPAPGKLGLLAELDKRQVKKIRATTDIRTATRTELQAAIDELFDFYEPDPATEEASRPNSERVYCKRTRPYRKPVESPKRRAKTAKPLTKAG